MRVDAHLCNEKEREIRHDSRYKDSFVWDQMIARDNEESMCDERRDEDNDDNDDDNDNNDDDDNNVTERTIEDGRS